MIRAVAAAFIFVWAGFLNGFILQTFNQDYSIEKWLANLIPCVVVFLAFILNLVFVPSIAQLLFGGGAGMAGRLGQVLETVLVARTA
jgi:type IV secretion system protein VirB6